MGGGGVDGGCMPLKAADRMADLFASGLVDDFDWLALLLQLKLDHLPMPGAGSTLERWRALATVGQFDLSLAKLYEGHTDALAILDELGELGELGNLVKADSIDGLNKPDTSGQHTADAAFAGRSGAWCVWAAEAPGGRTLIQPVHPDDASRVLLSGSKHWCSGATTAGHALLTAWGDDGSGPHLVAVELKQPGISIDTSRWKAVGMAGSMSVNVTFDGAHGRRVGQCGQYLSRAGFWQGGAGLAACWYGGAVGIACTLRASLADRSRDSASTGASDGADASSGYKLAALGQMELALMETAATLRQAAAWIDAYPELDASRVAITARLSAEKCARRVIEQAGKAMGATPFCLNEKFARAVADLPVFIRQTHADKDFAALGERCLSRSASAWLL